MLAGLWLLGCTHTVVVTTHPVAQVTRRGVTFASPGEVVCPRLGACRVDVTQADYRPFIAKLRFHRLALVPSHVELVLVPEHGPAGTWTPEDQGLVR